MIAHLQRYEIFNIIMVTVRRDWYHNRINYNRRIVSNCVYESARGRTVGEWKILEKFNRSLPLPLSGLILLATHFARLRSRYRLIDDYNNDRLLYIQRAPPVQSASKQIGSRFERSHAIIPISLPYVYQIYIYTHLEFFIFPLYMNSNQPSPNQVALIPASLQLVAITQIPRLSIHNLFVSINVREYVEVVPRFLTSPSIDYRLSRNTIWHYSLLPE